MERTQAVTPECSTSYLGPFTTTVTSTGTEFVAPLAHSCESVGPVHYPTVCHLEIFSIEDRHRDIGDRNSWLEEALSEIGAADREAREDGFEPPAAIAVNNARRIVEALSTRVLIDSPAIYPTEDREVAVLFQNSRAKSAVLVLCDSGGGGACFVTISGKSRRAHYDDAGDLPDAFLLNELRRLRDAAR